MLRIISVLFFLLVMSCSYNELGPPDCTASDLRISVGNVTPSTDCGTADGAITLSATGGKLPYTFSLNGVTQSNVQFSGVHAGIYSITVTDAAGCETSTHGVTVPASNLLFDVDVHEDNGCVTGNGAFTIRIENGNEGYQFAYNDGPFSSDSIFSGITHGVHVISVKDTAGCMVKLNISVPRGTTGVSWQQEILPIVETKCALSGCHNGISRPDLRIYDKAKFYASSIKKFTQDKSMPFDGTLTEEQIKLIACWVDDGALNN